MLLRVGSKGDDVERVQAGLNQAIAAGLVVDGDFGSATGEKVQEFQQDVGLEVDGLVGDQTWEALFREPYAPIKEEDRPIEDRIGPDSWFRTDFVFEPCWDGPSSVQPKGRDDLYDMFGNPGKGEADQAWRKANIVECHPRGSRAPLPGHENFQKEYWVAIHKDVEPYLREAMRRAAEACPGYIVRIGGYVFRHIRHDSSKPLSDHSWGVAVDINAGDNRGKSYKRGEAPEPWTKAWWAVWPKGIPQGVVAAFESCGFEWGGRWATFADPMHLSWANRNSEDQV